MADVSRGQLVVVSALVLAAVLVGLALVLNSGIYAENLGSRETSGDSQAVLEDRQSVSEHLGETVDKTNANLQTTNETKLEVGLQAAVSDQESVYAKRSAKRGTSVEFDIFDPREGTRLRQTNDSRPYTSADGATDWTLTDDVPDGGQFAMNVRTGTLFEATVDTTLSLVADSAFAVEFHLADWDESNDGDGVYRVFVFQGAATDSVYAVVEYPEQDFQEQNLSEPTIAEHVYRGWLNQSCSLEGEIVSIRLSEGTFGGSHCDEFDFYDDIDAHEVRYSNVEWSAEDDDVQRVRGTYDIFVETAQFNESAFNAVDETDDQPFHQSAMFTFNYSYRHERAGTTYAIDNQTVEPADRDDGGILWSNPRIERFNVTYLPGSTGNEFEVEWRVTDPDGELDRVELTLVERTTEETEEGLTEHFEDVLGVELPLLDDAEDLGEYIHESNLPINTNRIVDSTVRTDSVDGASARGTDRLHHESDLLSENYRLKLTVVDSSERSTTSNKRCDAAPDSCEVEA